MFGGYGLFVGKMFALLTSEGELCLKVNPKDSQRYQEAGFVKFGKMPYWRVPKPIYEDQQELLGWVQSSLQLVRE